MSEDLFYQIALTFVPGIGDVLSKKLIHLCGSPKEIFKAPRKHLKGVPRINHNLIASFNNKEILVKAEQELSFIEKFHIRPLYFFDKDYPARLKNCIDSPLILYYKGNADLNAQKVISMVGTRRATPYGKEMCYKLINGFRDDRVLVISGLAHGIDSYAHKAALDVGLPTVGVLGHGLDRIYPRQNRGLAEKMVSNGGIITDFPSNTNPDKENFPKRNRIIAGMSDAIIVVEAAEKGGALITAEIGDSYNRDVFAIPGRAGDNWSEGCNLLIQKNKAALVQSSIDVKLLMGWEIPKTKPVSSQRKIFIEMTAEEEKIVGILSERGKLSIDDIMLSAELSMNKCSVALLNLEFEGIVQSLPGRLYTLS